MRAPWFLNEDCNNFLTKEYRLPYLQAYTLPRRNEQPRSKCRTKVSHIFAPLGLTAYYARNSEIPEIDLRYL